VSEQPTPQLESIPALPDIIPVAKIRETPVSIWYRARQVRLDRDVLLKMRPIGGGAPGDGGQSNGGNEKRREREERLQLARAREEMVLLSRLHSDGIVAAFEANASGGWLYQVVELPPGSPLTQIFQERNREPWEPAEALEITGGILRAIIHAHGSRITLVRIHPEDIFLDSTGRVKIASLEWASGSGRSAALPLDLSWIAPEVVGGQIATSAADIYGVGILLTWLLTAKQPPASGLRHAGEKAVESLRARGISEDITALVEKLLDPSPEGRPSSASEVLEDLERIKESLGRRRFPVRILFPLALVLILALSGSVALMISAINSLGETSRETTTPELIAKTVGEKEKEGPPEKKEMREEPDPGKNLEPVPESPGDQGKTPAVDPAVEKRLLEISSAWEADPTTWARAISEVETFRDRQETPEASSLADQLIGKIRSDWQKRGREAVESFQRGELSPLLAAGDYLSALKQLEDLSGRFPGEAESIAALRKDLGEKQSRAIKTFQSEAKELIAGGDLDRAEARVGEVTGRLIPSDSSELKAITERIGAARKQMEEARKRVAEALTRAQQLIRDHRFDQAIQALEVDVDAPGDLAAPLATFRKELNLALSAKHAIESGLDRAIEEKANILTPIPGIPGDTQDREPETIILDGREGADLLAHPKGSTTKLRFPWFRLDPETLEKMAGREQNSASLQDGLMTLFLTTGEIDSASELLRNPGFSGSLKDKYSDRLLRARREAFLERTAGVVRRKEELSAGQKTSPEDWASLWKSTARLISQFKRETYFTEQRSRLEDTFLAARSRELRMQDPENLFHGEVLNDRRGLRIIYNFRDPGEIRDWTRLGPGTSLKQERDAIRLKGSIRLLRGNPFIAPIRIVVKVPAGGYPIPPHLGVIAASREPGAPPPSATKGSTAKKGSSKTGPGLAHALVMGYSTPSKALKVPGPVMPLKVAMPATALFACDGMLPRENEVTWASSDGTPVGPLILQADLTGTEFTGKVSGKMIMPKQGKFTKEKRGRHVLKNSAAEPIGSVTILTGKKDVVIQRIEVTAVLRKGWLEEQADDQARRELEKLLPPPKPAPGSSKKAK